MSSSNDHGSRDREARERAESSDVERLSRRKLLRAALYVPPAIIGSLLLTKDAGAQPISCVPNTGCQPSCRPSQCGPQICNPAG